MDLYNGIREIASMAQVSSSTHQRCVHMMKNLFNESSFDSFMEIYLKYVGCVLRMPYKSKNVLADRAIDFIAVFSTSMEANQEELNEDQTIVESPLLSKVFEYLLKAIDNYITEVRFRSCQLINKILVCMESGELSTDLFDSIRESMLIRIKDTVVAVRIQAATALHPFQDPSDPECPVIEEYRARMNCDPSSKVRKICIDKIALRTDVVRNILLKTRDVDKETQLAAYRKAINYPKQFKIVEKQMLFRNVFNNENETISSYVKDTLIPAWLDDYGGDYLKFMKALQLDSDMNDLDEYVEVIEPILEILFKNRPRDEFTSILKLNEERLLNFEDVDTETALFWRFLLKHLRASDEYDTSLQKFFPELTKFCSFIRNYYTSKEVELVDLNSSRDTNWIKYQFVLKQLFKMCMEFDFGDANGREALKSLVGDVLTQVRLHSDVVVSLIGNLYSILDTSETAQLVCAIVSDVLYQQEPQKEKKIDNDHAFKLAQMKVKVMRLKDDLQKCIEDTDFESAALVQTEISSLEKEIQLENESVKSDADTNLAPIKKTDRRTLTKVLDMVAALFESPKIIALDPMLRTLKDDVVQELLIFPDAEIQMKALRCYVLCCIVDEETAKVGVHMCCTFMHNDDFPGMKIAIGAVVDIITIFGTGIIASPAAEEGLSESVGEQQEAIFRGGFSLTSIINRLVELLQNETPEIQECAGTALCRLISLGRVQSPQIISRFLLKWSSPVTEEKSIERLRQIIGQTLAELSTNAESGEQIVNAVIPTVKTILKAPQSSPLFAINLENLMKFMIALLKNFDEEIQLDLAENVLNEIRSKPSRVLNNTLSKILLMLKVTGSNDSRLRTLLMLCEQIIEKQVDKLVLNNVTKFSVAVKAVCAELSIITEGEESEEQEEAQGTNLNESTVT